MSRVPRLIPGKNLMSLPLNPREAYLLSRIDAHVNELDLSSITGMLPGEITTLLDRLASMGVIEFIAVTPPPRAPVTKQTSVQPSSSTPLLPKLYDPSELDEAVELDTDKKRRILELYYRLEDLTYYELLGVGMDADKKQIKAAYYALAPEFHPDKYFRKNLGSYKAKIEAIFGRITLAQDVLTASKRREEYNEYLETTHRNRSISAMLERTSRDVAVAKAAMDHAAAAGGPSGRYETHTTGPTSVPMRPEDTLRRRKEALARKLTGTRRTPTGPASLRGAQPMEMDSDVSVRASEALRVRHETAMEDARRSQLQRYMEAGREALEQGDAAAAANAYRIAASLAPDDAEVQATCSEAMQMAAAVLADGYWKQATYEENQERWVEAALSYSKVCAGRPHDALAHERVANATLRSSANVRRAVEFARKAVELAPSSPEFRITLARTYGAAGLEKSMNGELDRALELAQANPRIQAIVAQVRAASPKEGKVS